MADISMLPTAGQKPWDGDLNQAVTNINVQLENTIGLPPGGTTGQALIKASDDDYDGEWGEATGVPPGGTTGQALVKQSGTDGDADWEDLGIPADSGWVNLTLSTGWTHLTGRELRVRKVGSRVDLTGIVVRATGYDQTNIAVVPVGYRMTTSTYSATWICNSAGNFSSSNTLVLDGPTHVLGIAVSWGNVSPGIGEIIPFFGSWFVD